MVFLWKKVKIIPRKNSYLYFCYIFKVYHSHSLSLSLFSYFLSVYFIYLLVGTWVAGWIYEDDNFHCRRFRWSFDGVEQRGVVSVAWLRFQLGTARFSDKIFEYSRARKMPSSRSHWMIQIFCLMEMVFHGFECSMMLCDVMGKEFNFLKETLMHRF